MNKKKIVAFVEPSFYGVSFAKAAYEQGCTVVSIVSSEDNPKKYGYEGIYHALLVADIRDEVSVFNAIQKSEFYGKLDALIPATDYATPVTAKVAERLGLKGIPYEAAFNARNKDAARNAYERMGVPGAKYQKIKSYAEAERASQDIGFPVVLKPTNAASSQNVFFINHLTELKQAMDEILDFKESYMGFKVREEYLIEEYLDGPEFSVEIFLSDGEPIFSVVTEKITSALPYFVELLHVLPSSVYHDQQADITNTAVSALKAIGILNGPSHVEVRLCKDGPRIIEVNGRPGGDQISSDLLIHALGFDIFKATVNYYLDQPIDTTMTRNKASSIAFLTAEKEGVITEIQGLEKIEHHDAVVRCHFSVQPGDSVSVAKSSDDRLGYVITVGDTPNAAKQSALALIGNITLKYQEEKISLKDGTN